MVQVHRTSRVGKESLTFKKGGNRNFAAAATGPMGEGKADISLPRSHRQR